MLLGIHINFKPHDIACLIHFKEVDSLPIVLNMKSSKAKQYTSLSRLGVSRKKMFKFAPEDFKKTTLRSKCLLYFEGLYDEEPDHGPEFYMHFFSPRLAQMMESNRSARLIFLCIRRFWIWNSLFFLVFNALVLSPMGIYTYYGSKKDVVDNVFAICIWMLVFVFFVTILLRTPFIPITDAMLDKYSAKKYFRNQAQKDRIDFVTKTSKAVYYSLHFVFVPLFTTLIILYATFYCLPRRKQLISVVFPFDTSLTPIYEITVYWDVSGVVTCCTICTSLMSAMTKYFLSLLAYMHILVENITSIKDTCVKNVKKKISTRTEQGKTVQRTNEAHCRQDVVKQSESFESSRRVGKRPAVSKWTKIKTIPRCYFPKLYFTKEVEFEMCTQIKKYISIHNDLLSCGYNILAVLDPPLVALFVFNIVYGGMITMVLSSKTISGKDVLFLVTTVMIVITFFLMNYMGELITVKSEEVLEALYFCDWVDASPSFKQLMLIMMSQGNNTLVMKPTGLNPMCLRMFVEVLNTAYKTTTAVISMAKA